MERQDRLTNGAEFIIAMNQDPLENRSTGSNQKRRSNFAIWAGVVGAAIASGVTTFLVFPSKDAGRGGAKSGREATVAKADQELDARAKKLAKERGDSSKPADASREATGILLVGSGYMIVPQRTELGAPQTSGIGRDPGTSPIAVGGLQVEVQVNETDLSKVRLGQRCIVSPKAYPDRSYQGEVAEIAPVANRAQGTLQVKVQIREPDQYLTPELSAKVEFLEH